MSFPGYWRKKLHKVLATSASPASLLEMQNLRHQARPSELEPQEVEPSSLHFNKLSDDSYVH